MHSRVSQARFKTLFGKALEAKVGTHPSKEASGLSRSFPYLEFVLLPRCPLPRCVSNDSDRRGDIYTVTHLNRTAYINISNLVMW